MSRTPLKHWFTRPLRFRGSSSSLNSRSNLDAPSAADASARNLPTLWFRFHGALGRLRAISTAPSHTLGSVSLTSHRKRVRHKEARMLGKLPIPGVSGPANGGQRGLAEPGASIQTPSLLP